MDFCGGVYNAATATIWRGVPLYGWIERRIGGLVNKVSLRDIEGIANSHRDMGILFLYSFC